MREGAGPRHADATWRLDAIEERLGRIEDLLRAR
jgi:hypothetical protein